MSKSRSLCYLLFVVLGIIICSGLWNGVNSVNISELLTHAYSDHRTVALRLRSTPYAPLREQRGQRIAGIDRPQSLLEAEAAISRSLRKTSQDSSLLAAEGEANLIEGAYDAAILISSRQPRQWFRRSA
jgi:hypothetical protein